MAGSVVPPPELALKSRQVVSRRLLGPGFHFIPSVTPARQDLVAQGRAAGSMRTSSGRCT